MTLHTERAAPRRSILAILLAATCTSTAVAQSTTRVSLATNGAEANDACIGGTISDDGRFVTVWSAATNLVAGVADGLGHVYVRDRVLGSLEHVSVSATGALASASCDAPSISRNGRFVVFQTRADNLVPGDTNFRDDVFVHDRQTHTTELVSVALGGAPGNDSSRAASLSADGRFVVFESWATDLVLGDTNGRVDVFLRDRLNGTTECVSFTPAGTASLLGARFGAISSTGRFVTFTSESDDLVAGDTNARDDVFLRDRVAQVTERVSVGAAGVEGNGRSGGGTLSDGGRFVAFTTLATNLDGSGARGAGTYRIVLRDRVLDTTERVDVTYDGTPLNAVGSVSPSLSGDGHFVVFRTDASNIVAGDTNLSEDVFLRDLLLDTTERVSIATGGTEGETFSGTVAPRPISGDGRYVVFFGPSTNLVPSDSNGFNDVFVRERQTSIQTSILAFCFGDGSDTSHTTTCPCGNAGAPGNGCAHSFDAGGANLSAFGSTELDQVRLDATREPATSFTMFLQHSARGDFIFHDGISCAGGALVRLRGRPASGGAVSFPDSAFAIDATTTLSQRGGVVPGFGARRYYSAWYRNVSTTFCPPATANVTNGLQVDW